MYRKTAYLAACVVILPLLLATTGCYTGSTTFGYNNLGFFSYPIPLSPYFQDKFEDKAWEDERYNRVAVLGPITAGGPAVALDPPSDDEVMRALERASPVEGGLPFGHEIQRNNVRITKELLADYVDEPRVYPLIGPAQLHHAHYRCIIHYTETTRVGWPVPYTNTDTDRQEVVYVDHDHFHMVGNMDGGPGSNY